jgi:hypothetical protein
MATKEEKIIISRKFNYILEKYLTGVEAQNTFGYKSPAHISNLRHESQSQTLTSPHFQLLKLIHQIPIEIWKNDIIYTEKSDEKVIDKIIEKYREAKITETSTFNKQNSVYIPLLLGDWYVYSYSTNPKRYEEGIIILETTIHKDYSVTDSHNNTGYLNIRSKESYIEKKTNINENITLIRFSNSNISYGIFNCSINASERGTNGLPLFNFGFFSRKKYSPKEAKYILGNRLNLQLKSDLNFLDRINKEM